MTEYTTQQGDTWDLIAWRVYGTEHRVATLIEANPGHRKTVVFAANQVITIPPAPRNERESAPAPPWRR